MISQYARIIKKNNEDWKEKGKKYKIDYKELFKKIHLDTIQLLHHIFDWYAMNCPDMVYRKTPEQLAVISYLIFEGLHFEMF
jgi:hypothetical protein